MNAGARLKSPGLVHSGEPARGCCPSYNLRWITGPPAHELALAHATTIEQDIAWIRRPLQSQARA